MAKDKALDQFHHRTISDLRVVGFETPAKSRRATKHSQDRFTDHFQE
ncbi:hypothetical protein RB12268 [Rhodopirellula baltica SH 1]|uniref:Uncharacterized protein n=1 Tax=Rhodopirellula baltica (strain DSM 10527 / NCIMB 13988 / SH1) TaxID=243090 RepID=Q7UIX6_RHOBA|nr:hypothetical protein RB12268 [Rhodopirellula baltica SH 1]